MWFGYLRYYNGMRSLRWYSLVFVGVFLCAAVTQASWNSPYPRAWMKENTLFSAFSSPPKTLDPGKSYSSNEWVFLANIVEPPLQYHYLKRPYTLEPLILTAMPQVRHLDAQGRLLAEEKVLAVPESVAVTEYELTLREDVRYAPHPAFVRDDAGQPRYRWHTADWLSEQGIRTLDDFPERASRAVTAADLAYAIARMSDRRVGSPIADVMMPLIVGMQASSEALAQRPSSDWRDLRGQWPSGVEVVDERTLRIRIQGLYPPFIYWLAMPFFAPVPWEVDAFYAQPGMKARNLSWDWQPVGSGAFRLAENNPNRRMVLARNPLFHAEVYPSEGAADTPPALLADAGQSLPFIDRVVFALEKEAVPYWSKFLQGYYDASGVASEVFDQAIRLDERGRLSLTPSMQDKGIALVHATAASSSYLGFNMRDPLLGQDNPRGKLLRQAISLAVDYEEYVSIFLNGRGLVAQGPIPPGIAGFASDCNPVTHQAVGAGCARRPLSEARALMAQAGYADGIDPATGKVLVLYYDTVSSGADDKAQLDWMRKQFAKLGIQLVIRATDYNRFQEKMRAGNAQIYTWGWNADYPDAENFLFLLYGPNAKAVNGGENASNFAHADFDALFERISRLPPSSEREALVRQAVSLLRDQAPWIWGVHPQNVSLFHGWVRNVWPNLMANNTLKYRRLEVATRAQAQEAWNQPVLWPLWLGGMTLLLAVLAGWWGYVRYQQQRRVSL